MNGSVNYLSLLRHFWDEVPFLPGYKSEYGIVFLSIVDSINRNGWRETAIEYDRLINKIKCNKRTYYAALKWLSGDSQLLTYTPGRNDYALARFGLGKTVIEVQKCTAEPQVEVQKCTSTVTSTAPIIDKHNKPIKLKNIGGLSFDLFWDAYGKKQGSKPNALKSWNSLTEKEKQAALDAIPAYKAHQPDPQYRKDPERYLKHRIWENDFTIKASPTARTLTGPTKATIHV